MKEGIISIIGCACACARVFYYFFLTVPCTFSVWLGALELGGDRSGTTQVPARYLHTGSTEGVITQVPESTYYCYLAYWWYTLLQRRSFNFAPRLLNPSGSLPHQSGC